MITIYSTFGQLYADVLAKLQDGPLFTLPASDTELPTSELSDKFNWYGTIGASVVSPIKNIWFSWEVIHILRYYLHSGNFSGKQLPLTLGITTKSIDTTAHTNSPDIVFQYSGAALDVDTLASSLTQYTNTIKDTLTTYRYLSIPLLLAGFVTDDTTNTDINTSVGVKKALEFAGNHTIPTPSGQVEMPGKWHRNYLFALGNSYIYNNIVGSTPLYYAIKHANIGKLANQLISFYTWQLTGTALDGSALPFKDFSEISPIDLLCIELPESAGVQQFFALLLAYNTLTMLLKEQYFANYILNNADSTDADNPFVYFASGSSTDYTTTWLGDLSGSQMKLEDKAGSYLPVFLSVVFNSLPGLKSYVSNATDYVQATYQAMDNILTNYLLTLEAYEAKHSTDTQPHSYFDFIFDANGYNTYISDADAASNPPLNSLPLSGFDIAYTEDMLESIKSTILAETPDITEDSLAAQLTMAVLLADSGPEVDMLSQIGWNWFDLTQGKTGTVTTKIGDMSFKFVYPTRRQSVSLDSAFSLGLFLLNTYIQLYHANKTIDSVPNITNKTITSLVDYNTFNIQPYIYYTASKLFEDPYGSLKNETYYTTYLQLTKDTLSLLYDSGIDTINATMIEFSISTLNSYYSMYGLPLKQTGDAFLNNVPSTSVRWYNSLFYSGDPTPDLAYPRFSFGEVLFADQFVTVVKTVAPSVIDDYANLTSISSEQWSTLLLQQAANLQTAIVNYIPPVVESTYLLNGHAYSEFAPAVHNHDDLYLKPEDVTDVTYLVELDGQGNIVKKHTPDEFALVGHTHPQYYKKTDIVANAQFLIDKATGKKYTASDFAKVGHTHPQYLPKGSVGYAAYKLNGEEPSAFALADHNHDDLYLKKSDAAAAAYHLNGVPSSAFALADHNHDDLYYTKDALTKLFIKRDDLTNPDNNYTIASATAINFYAIKPGEALLLPGKELTVELDSGYIYGAHTTLIGDNPQLAHPFYTISQDGTSITFKEITGKYPTQFYYLIIYDIRSKHILEQNNLLGEGGTL